MLYYRNGPAYTAQKMTFSIKGFSSKCDQICGKLRIWSYLLEKSLMENIVFCAVLGAVVKERSDQTLSAKATEK